MMRGLLSALILWVCVVIIHGEWFPPMKEAVSAEKLDSSVSNFDVASSYQTCKTLHSGDRSTHKFITLYKEIAMTYVLTGNGEGDMDIKFKDSNYIFEQKIKISKDKYMIIPPYQPVEWILVRFSGPISVCSYSDSHEEAKGTTKATGCECDSSISAASSFSVASFPRTIRKPEQQFFLTADKTPEPNDVTICTILTVDRLLRLSQMSQMWGGPISAAVFLHDLKEITDVMSWYMSNNTLRRHVDIHIVHDDKIVPFPLPDRAFPVNILRNVAIRFARTANVFYIEGDFIPSPDLYPSLDIVKKELAKEEKKVFIVAPFSIDNANFDMKDYPKDKDALRKMVNSGSAKDLSYFNSHAAFDFNNWYRSTSIYPMSFAGGYEPYYIGPKNYPLFEEIFIGCGADKVSHPAELNSAGYKFHVIPTGFIIHIDSSGMGSAWCRGWAGNERSTMKWEAFTTKTANIYRNNNGKTSYDSRISWWDLSPVGQKALPKEDEVCMAPSKEEREKEESEKKEKKEREEREEREKAAGDKTCPPCPANLNPACGPVTSQDCEKFTEELRKQLAEANEKIARLESDHEKRSTQFTNMENSVKTLKTENDKLQEHSKFILNVSVGGMVVLVVVVGVGACIWPRGRKVWLPTTWKPTHHNL